MRCVRCEFENIPGQTRCIRCGSILTRQGAAVAVHPPRMPVWRGPLRAMTRWLRGLRILPERSPMGFIRRALGRILTDGVVGVLLSIVPGLAHGLKGRFKEVRPFVALWLLFLALGLFLYGSTVGLLLIGLAIGLHAWIAVQYGLFKEMEDFRLRIVAILIVVALVAALYRTAPRLAAPELTGGYTAISVPALRIHEGDYLLVRRLSDADCRLPRGALVLIHPPGFRNTGQDTTINPNNLMIGQIVGLPGETIRVRDRTYIVGPQQLDADRFPVPRWLHDHPLKSAALVPGGSYFVSMAYDVSARGNATPTDGMICDACIVEASGIRGRAFMRWWPLGRRGFIEQD